MKEVTVLKKRGRPSLYSDALAAEICERLSKGETLQSICEDDHLPVVRTVNLWTENKPGFSSDFAAARARGFDAIAAEALTIADDDTLDWKEVLDDEGRVVGHKVDGEHVTRSKLRIETRLKLLAKWDPKRYGEKLELNGPNGGPIRVEKIEWVIVDQK